MLPLTFDNRFTRSLPADPDSANRPRQVLGACYSRVAPEPARAPKLVAASREVLEQLGLTAADARSQDFAEVFSGARVLDGMDCHAMCYGGHQFGHWAGQLGDGRAINLGEVRDQGGALQMLQLKGAGPTPYSRGADGLAVLRSSVREFLCSEAMHHLGVPTTRALSLVLTGETVVRDMFYDGHPENELGAVVCRVAPSFLRLGSYEILAATGQTELLRTLVRFTLETLYPELAPGAGEELGACHVVPWFEEVCRRTAAMVVHWQRVGFVHGVMNTDNLSILGLTIDYGPYGWLEDYDPGWTPNTTDAQHRRYRYGQQGRVAQWNLAQLANALVPLVEGAEGLQAAIDGFAADYETRWRTMMAHKLGLAAFEPSTDQELVAELLEVLQSAETDMTVFYRRLAAAPREALAAAAADDAAALALLDDAYYVPAQRTAEQRARTRAWLARYAARVAQDGAGDAARRARMDAVNPKYVLRNYLAQVAIDRADDGDFGLVAELLDVLRRPYDEQPEHEHHAAKRPDWARHRPGCSQLSCSS